MSENPKALREFAEWIVSMDDPDDVLALEERRSVTMTVIIERAREALAEATGQTSRD